jgi:hypothetical protein
MEVVIIEKSISKICTKRTILEREKLEFSPVL